MRVVVVGGGIVGLATARLIAREQPGAEVTVLEKEPQLALHQTATTRASCTPGSTTSPAR